MEKNQFSFSTLIATCGFIGYTPFVPGTAASLVAMLVLYALPPLSLIVHFIILNVLFFVGTVVSEQYIIKTGKKDPPSIVIDEWFGIWLALFLAPQIIWVYILAFVIFRIFDIVKPWPINAIEKTVPGGLGVMLDDACAGLFTFCILQAICMVL